MQCHLPFHLENYVGSYVEGNQTVDVYNYPIKVRRAMIEIGEKARAEEENLTQNAKAYQGDFEDSYNVYADEDEEAEEGDP